MCNLNTLNKAVKQKSNFYTKQLANRTIQITRVTKVTKGGKKLSFRAVVVIGNQNGKVGLGVGKANEISNAIKKAKINGIKHLIRVPITKSFSIPHNVSGHYGACKIIMRPSIEGSGVSAGGAVRIVVEIAGIRNIIAKQLGSSNLLNNAKATIDALIQIKTSTQIF